MRTALSLIVSLLITLPALADNAEELWQKARQEMLTGEKVSTKEAKREHFSKGVEYARQAIEADPSNPDCYMWHSANVGRLCQTQPLMEQIKAVPVMMEDLSMILETLGHTDYYAAWQALAEIYYHHPFKSTNSAICFMRKALSDFPEDLKEPYIYEFLANALYKRNWSAEKRLSQQRKDARAFNEKHDSAVERYSHYDGVASCLRWSDKSIGEMSDREEALLIQHFISIKLK